MSASGLEKIKVRPVGEVMAAMSMRERAAHLIDKMGDQAFADGSKTRNVGIATITQRHYIACASAVRDLALSADAPADGAGTIAGNLLEGLRDGIADMRQRGVINDATDGQWLDAKLAEINRALQLLGRQPIKQGDHV